MTETIRNKSLPLFYRIIVLIILIQSILGCLLFILATLGGLSLGEFLTQNSSVSEDSTNIHYYVIVNLILNLGMLMSSILLLRLKKRGLYLFAALYFILIIVNSFILSQTPFVVLSIGLFLLIPLVFYMKKMH